MYEETVICSECQARVSTRDADFWENEEMGVCGFTCHRCIENEEREYMIENNQDWDW